jgi:hypothetical protein
MLTGALDQEEKNQIERAGHGKKIVLIIFI